MATCTPYTELKTQAQNGDFVIESSTFYNLKFSVDSMPEHPNNCQPIPSTKAMRDLIVASHADGAEHAKTFDSLMARTRGF
jgi:hypothetical protein